MRQLSALLILLMFMAGTAFAHGGLEHVSAGERWIAGIGLIILIITSAFSLLSQPEENLNAEDDQPQQDD